MQGHGKAWLVTAGRGMARPGQARLGRARQGPLDYMKEVAQMDATVHLTLTGTRPLVQHNGRLANPLDPYTRQIAAISKKRSKTDDDIAELAHLEARGSMYETEDGLIGIPAANVWKSIHEAAKAYKLGKDVERALVQHDGISPVLLDGEPLKCDTFLGGDDDRLYFVAVGVNGRKVMRSRPRIPSGWTAQVSFEILADVLDPERLEPVLARAGRVVGLMERRPMFGAYIAEMEVTA